MNITDVPNSGIYVQRGSIVQIVVRFIDQNTGLPLNIQAADSMTMAILYPDLETTLDVQASLYSDGSDGRISYITKNTIDQIDLSQFGLYQIQGTVVIGGITQPPSLPTDFFVNPNVEDVPMAPIFTASAFVLFDSNGVRWAITVGSGPSFVSTAQATGPQNALILQTMVMKDDQGVYWTITVDTAGNLVGTLGGTFDDSIDRLTLIDSSGISHVVTVSETGVLTVS